MGLKFPNDPVVDDIFGIYRWDGEKWTTSPDTPAGLAPVVIFTQTPPLAGSDSNPNVCFKIACTTTEAMGDEFRITLQPGAMLTVPHAGLGEWDGSPVPTSTVPIIEALFGGAPGFADKTTPQVSDWMPSGALKGKPAGSKLLVSFQTGVAGKGLLGYNTSSANTKGFYQSDTGGTYWGIADASGKGFNDLGAMNFGAAAIESRGTSGGSGSGPVPNPGVIPIAFDDPIFTGMQELTAPIILDPGQDATRKSIIEQGNSYSILCHFDNEVTFCRVKSREAVRLEGGTTLIRYCYLEAEGLLEFEDHADTLQCYSPGERNAHMIVMNTHVRAFPGAATAGFFCADNWGGTLTFEDVIFQSGPYGLKVSSDPTCHIDVSLKNCFFVGPFANDQDNQPHIFTEVGSGTMAITKWENVRMATISGNVLTPGATLPPPSIGIE